ncbi:hypothetical protein AAHB37_07045 [Glutamicibacter halophytocola]|uniref:hypothetical protein n=1 Tax=Glutamicibacter halophytocola TaxID=1933880 RepID=UPI00321BD11A
MPQLDGEAPLTLIEPSVNDPKAAPVELVIKAKGEFTASLGRSYDVDAWVDNAAHVSLTGIDTVNHKMIAEYVDGEAEVPNPAGDDIFFDSQSADGTMTYRWTAPDSGDWSLLLAAGGKDAAPVDISVTYANDDAMPFAAAIDHCRLFAAGLRAGPAGDASGQVEDRLERPALRGRGGRCCPRPVRSHLADAAAGRIQRIAFRVCRQVRRCQLERRILGTCRGIRFRFRLCFGKRRGAGRLPGADRRAAQERSGRCPEAGRQRR